MDIKGVRSLLSVMRYYSCAASVCRTVVSRRQLFFDMSKRELYDRYVGQVLGSFWVILNPILFMGVYLFVFSYVFQARMSAPDLLQSPGWGGDYALFLLSGLVPWMGLQEVITRSTTCITGNSNLVKQIVFPEEILPLKIIISSLVTQCVALTFVGIYAWCSLGPPPATVALIPVLVFFEVLAMAGFSLIFSALSPFFRDIKDMVGILCFVLIYAMPIFYTPGMLSRRITLLIMLNPLSHMIECWHDAIYWGRFASPISWIVFPVFSILLFGAGCRFFSILKNMFGNML